MKWQVVGIALVALLLNGCTTFGSNSGIQKRDKAYLQAKSIPALRIPPGFDTSQFENRYPVSDRNDPDNTKSPSLIPPGA